MTHLTKSQKRAGAGDENKTKSVVSVAVERTDLNAFVSVKLWLW